jgi:O-6-methylguanine DNA methyltransferase
VKPAAVTAVRTTKVFCRPGCPARPLPRNTVRYDSVGAALVAGYRPCRRCHPLHDPAHPPRRDAPPVRLAVVPTPLGPMIGGDWNGQLVLLEFADRRMLATQFRRLARQLRCTFAAGSTPLLRETGRQLAQYFAGRLATFTVPLATPGTAFQRAAWAGLRRIPAGVTRSYAAQARAIGKPHAVRAVARANGDNRIAIVIPCHRVLGADGSLTGYGGKLWRKRALLQLEGVSAAAAGTGASPATTGTAPRRR